MMGQMVEPLVTARTSAAIVSDFCAWMSVEQRRVYGLCLRLLQDRDEADSATQDVFFKAYQALKKEDAKDLEDPSRWITRIAVNTCLDRLRSRKWQFWRKRAAATGERAVLALARSKSPEAEDRYFAGQISLRLDAALSRLSPRQRAVFTLRHYEDRSLEEIGTILGLDVGTVKAHMFRAVSKLRQELRDLYEGSR
ncbi:MAG TPA: RNA polymerase sigma factor [Bryobacteraceae bacterium]|nr:RNA polymerase sigma factor [Bryobacteraceae bacterium]